jgi:hypothetical protein
VKLIDGDAAAFWHAGATETEVLGDKWHPAAPTLSNWAYILAALCYFNVRKHVKVFVMITSYIFFRNAVKT